MKELAKEYKKSISLLNQRINELLMDKIRLISESEDPDKDPNIVILEDRIKPLKHMQRDSKETAKEVEHYFDSGWWRSEKYTLKSRKSRKFVYCEPTYYDSVNEFEDTGKDEAIFKDGYHICFDGETEKSFDAVL
jgi:hypothetical protein